MDKYYTPEDMASKLIAHIPKRPKAVADFSAGEGSLLLAARRKWPTCHVIATDLDRVAVSRLAKLSNSSVGKCDFLSQRSRSSCAALKPSHSADVILLNPPFSCRGNSFRTALLRDEKVKCSPAMAFVIGAIHYLRAGGHIAAILPASCMTSERDAGARAAISRRYRIEWVPFEGDLHFRGCEVAIVFAYISPGTGEHKPTPKFAPAIVDKEAIQATLSRGSFPMDQAEIYLHKRGLKLIHSTGLSNNGIEHTHRVRTARSIVVGPAILVPRVGKLNKSKICLKLSTEQVAISDCIIALQAASQETLLVLYQRLLARTDQLATGYEGSCAKYITLARLRQILKNMNVDAQIEYRGSRSKAGEALSPLRPLAAKVVGL